MPKINGKELEDLRTALEPHDTEELRDLFRRRDPGIPNIELVQDIDKRYRWEVARRAIGSRGITRLYDDLGCNDSHIDTALRSIVPPLGDGCCPPCTDGEHATLDGEVCTCCNQPVPYKVGDEVATVVHSIGGRSTRVTGEVVGFSRPDGKGYVNVATTTHGTLSVERAKVER